MYAGSSSTNPRQKTTSRRFVTETIPTCVFRPKLSCFLVCFLQLKAFLGDIQIFTDALCWAPEEGD